MALLEIDAISVYYGEMIALHDVSASVQAGEIISIVGANGAGKSTLINTISGIMKPSTGEIRFNNEKISQLEAYQVVEKGVVQVPEGRRLFPKERSPRTGVVHPGLRAGKRNYQPDR